MDSTMSWTVSDRATYANPHQVAAGIDHVFVNGTQIVNHAQPVERLGKQVGERLPGRALRFKQSVS